MAPKAAAKAEANADVVMLKATNVWLWSAMEDAVELGLSIDVELGDNTKFIRLVNKRADQLVKAIRAGLREAVRELPGRAQKGEVDRIMRAAAPKLKKVLKP
jgi:hypothetical protein